MRRVVITGLGVVSTLGSDIGTFWNNLIEGKSEFKQSESFRAKKYRASVISTLEYDKIYEANRSVIEESKKLYNCTKLGILAARQALTGASLEISDYNKRLGLSIATTSGGNIEAYLQSLYYNGNPDECPPNDALLGSSSSHIARSIGLKGPVCTFSSACTSGTISIGHAYESIKNSDADCMIAGGCDSLQEIAFAGFNCMRIVAKDVCRPFAADRKGIIIGDGAAMLVLEEYESAKKRNAPIIAEIVGSGISCDAFHATAPNAIGATKAMNTALSHAELKPEQIKYVNCHGTGTKLNDRVEVEALRQVFGDSVRNLYATSTKANLGHLLGTAGSIEMLITSLVIKNSAIPPMANWTSPDDRVDFKVVHGNHVKETVEYAMNNSFGFGGNNVSMVLKSAA